MRLLFLTALIIAVEASAQHITEFHFMQIAPETVTQTMQLNAGKVFAEIHTAYELKQDVVNIPPSCATAEGIKNIKMLWDAQKFYCTETEIIAKVLSTSKGWQVRNIPVFFADGVTDEDKYQDMVLEFTSDGRISDLYIALSPIFYQQNMEVETLDVSELRQRQQLWRFLENFYTAFFRKDIAFLNKVFENGVDVGQNPTEAIRRVINENSFTIRFDEVSLIKHAEQSDFYGVTMQLKWKTDFYSDEGWLFLLIDIRDEENPMIWVRTWQPLTTPREKVFSILDFPVQ